MIHVLHEPQRTCIGCRRRDSQPVLLRMVCIQEDGVSAVVADPHRRMAGRGAWLHPGKACLESALKKRSFNRAFRAPVRTDAVQGYLNAKLETVRTESGTEI